MRYLLGIHCENLIHIATRLIAKIFDAVKVLDDNPYRARLLGLLSDNQIS
jgi:hypothetical protein